MRIAPCDWRGGVPKLRRKSSALPAGNLLLRRRGRIYASLLGCCVRILVSRLCPAHSLCCTQGARLGESCYEFVENVKLRIWVRSGSKKLWRSVPWGFAGGLSVPFCI